MQPQRIYIPSLQIGWAQIRYTYKLQAYYVEYGSLNTMRHVWSTDRAVVIDYLGKYKALTSAALGLKKY